jgi:hypothetical protein
MAGPAAWSPLWRHNNVGGGAEKWWGGRIVDTKIRLILVVAQVANSATFSPTVDGGFNKRHFLNISMRDNFIPSGISRLVRTIVGLSSWMSLGMPLRWSSQIPGPMEYQAEGDEGGFWEDGRVGRLENSSWFIVGCDVGKSTDQYSWTNR